MKAYAGQAAPRLVAYRAFVAVPVPPEAALAALADELAATRADLHVTDPARHHLTLSFPGDVPDDATPALAHALDAACAGEPAFDLHLHGVGAFPKPDRPRVVWAGARPEPALVRIEQNVRARLKDAGQLGDDKPFKVHLTLARMRTPRGQPEVAAFVRRNAERPLPSIPVREVRLYRSTLDPRGARYDVMHETRLGGA